MKMYAISANSMRELVQKANESGIQKEQFVQIIPESSGIFTLFYFSKDDE